MKHLRYLKYLVIHKAYVLFMCLKFRIPLRGLRHDLSKLRPFEWWSYAGRFYGTGSETFDLAVWRHKQRNDHHWEHWVAVSGSITAFPMPRPAILEMLADWWAMSAQKGQANWTAVRRWYVDHRLGIVMHPDTRHFVEVALAYLEATNQLPKELT